MNIFFKIIPICTLFLIFLTGCERDSKNGNNITRDFIVAFEEQSISYSEITDSKSLSLVFSESAVVDGSVELEINSVKSSYGLDFETKPAAVHGKLILPFVKGDRNVNFDFVNLIYPFDRSDKTVEFRIVKVNYSYKQPIIQGFDIMVVSFDTAIGGVLEPPIGGPSQPMQVYVDLGGKAMYPVLRTNWDLAFYSGEDFRVKINGAIYMAAGSINATNIDNVRESDFSFLKKKVQIGTFDPGNIKYIDFPSGDLNNTAINRIETDDTENKVYLINMGFVPGSGNVAKGAVDITGKERGWKKIRVLRQEDGYLLQYADLDSASHNEVLIPKSNSDNFTFFSFDTESTAIVEPSANKWDISFTVFTNTVAENGDPKGSYGFSDFIVNNRYGGVVTYAVKIPENDKNFYKNFSLVDIDSNLFLKDLRSIGDTWRVVTTEKKLVKNIFYVIKDTKGNFYKMRVLGFMNDKGERGYPKIEYSLLR